MQYYKITHFDCIDSTNTYALTHLDLLKDRDVIQADLQTKGYGRFKRHWISPSSSNIYVSVILKPDVYHNAMANLTQYMSLVICRIFETYNVHADLKWPNDVLVNGAKIAGLLSETSFQGNEFKGYVLGVGINLNMTQDELDAIDQKAVSLNFLINQPVNRDNFLTQLLDWFFSDYKSVLQKGFSVIKSDYLRRSPYIGMKVKVTLPNAFFQGIAEGLTDDGCLILKLDSGENKIFTAGDVSVVGKTAGMM